VEIDVVTLDLARAFVLVEVERPTVIGHLRRPVDAGGLIGLGVASIGG
jgi:hypothetical protein